MGETGSNASVREGVEFFLIYDLPCRIFHEGQSKAKRRKNATVCNKISPVERLTEGGFANFS
jgi:hypothetical protein